jgi:tripartite-type tricarboxylate transporter receptor subunit TctC
MRTFLRGLGLLVAVLFVAFPAAAQYPSKPIRIVVPFPSGSATDTIVRILAQPMSQSLKQPILVENKPGADGSIAAAEVMRAAPDGYTLLMATNSPLAAVPTMRKTPPYDPIADFTPISYFGKFTYFVLVHPSVPAKTLAELINHAKSNPGSLNFATGNTFGLISTAQLMNLGGINLLQVPYKGEPPALIDLVAGRVHFMFATQTTSLPFVQQGKLRPLATTNSTRVPQLPDVPTIAEAGMSRFSILPWAALFGPAKMPADIVARINQEMAAALKRPEIKEQLARQAFEPSSSTPEALQSFLNGQIEAWSQTLAQLGIQPE